MAHELAFPTAEESEDPFEEIIDEPAVPDMVADARGAEQVHTTEPSKQELELVDRAIARLHRNLGHCGSKPLAAVLQQAGAQPWIVQRAKRYKCDVCQQVAAKQPLPVASAETPILIVEGTHSH